MIFGFIKQFLGATVFLFCSGKCTLTENVVLQRRGKPWLVITSDAVKSNFQIFSKFDSHLT